MKLRLWVKVVLVMLGVALFMYVCGLLLNINREANDRAFDFCLNQGNSYEYCMGGIYG